MNRHIWELHAAVFELVRARGLRRFEVHYVDAGERIEIELTLPPASDAHAAGDSSVRPSAAPC
jgi:hypothetical protein